VGALIALNRTLEQELQALVRGASLECLVCGEFVLRLPDGSLFCPECGSALAAGSRSAASRVDCEVQAG
jgi:hypothetical protein